MPTEKIEHDRFNQDDWAELVKKPENAVMAGLQLLHRLTQAVEQIGRELVRIERRIMK